MIESIQFKNFKALRDTTLPLGRFTLIVGPNGSGKSTVLKAFQNITNCGRLLFSDVRSVGIQNASAVEISMSSKKGDYEFKVSATWKTNKAGVLKESFNPPTTLDKARAVMQQHIVKKVLTNVRVFSLDAEAIARTVQLAPSMQLEPNGQNLPGVLDRLRDENPERFEALNEELKRWLPEFDRILFETPQPGCRAVVLRTSEGGHKIPAHDLSQGTLIALALLTLAYIPNPPSIVCLEEPDRALHPRLLRDVRDAIYRLAYPESCGEKRDPVQVIATTHSPYFLDLFKDHPEEIVIAEKVGLEAKFTRLIDRPDIKEILADAPLGEAWYSGVLGGVPSTP